MTRKRVVIGDEWDAATWRAAQITLEEMGAVLTNQLEGVAGSQEARVRSYLLRESAVELAQETYCGMWIEGDCVLVGAVAQNIRERLANSQVSPQDAS